MDEDERDDPDEKLRNDLLWLESQGFDVDDQFVSLHHRLMDEALAFRGMREAAGEPVEEPTTGWRLAGVVSEDPRRAEARHERLRDAPVSDLRERPPRPPDGP